MRTQVGPRAHGALIAVLAVIAALGCASTAGAASGGALDALRTWGTTLGAQADRGTVTDATLAADAQNLRDLVPAAAAALRALPAAEQQRQLDAARDALAHSLDPVPAEIGERQTAYFTLVYQAQLERLATQAGLSMAPTGRVLAAAADLTPPQARNTLYADSDADGRVDARERDDDGDGIPDQFDPSDSGWGIPDAWQAREDDDGDANEDGVPDDPTTRPHSPCEAIDEAIPDPASVGDAVAYFRGMAALGRCSTPLFPFGTLPAADDRPFPTPARKPTCPVFATVPTDTDADGKPDTDGQPDCGRVDPAAGDCVTGKDTDGDGVLDCDEIAGFKLKVRVAGSDPVFVQTSSDPNDPNTDHDTITVGGVDYALDDGVETGFSAAGGTSNPRVLDSDGDGLKDVAEIRRYGTIPAANDSDGDSTGPDGKSPPNPALNDGGEVAGPGGAPTDPMNVDTDGDTQSDYAELVTAHTNPRVAQVPSFTLERGPGAVTIEIPTTDTEGTITARAETVTTMASRTDQHTDQVAKSEEASVNASITAGCKDCKILGGGLFNFGGGGKWTKTTTTTDQTTLSQSSQTAIQDTYTKSLTRVFSPQGTMTASFEVRNTSSLAILIKSLNVTASDARGTIAVLVPTGDISLGPGESRTVTMRSLNAAGQPSADTQTLRGFMASPGNLSFTTSTFILANPATGADYNGIYGSSVDNATAGLTIDFGRTVGSDAAPGRYDGTVERYAVATNVDRDWGAPLTPAGTKVVDLLRTVLKIPFETTKGSDGKAVLSSIRDKASVPVAPDGSLPGAWLALGDAKGITGSFDDVLLEHGQTLALSYLADNDHDGLFDRTERQLGTSDFKADTDGDGVTDKAEAQTGWTVPFPPDAEAYPVFSSPLSCDADNDGSPDGPGPGDTSGKPGTAPCPKSQFKSESERRTNPLNPDTNNDSIKDGIDPTPLDPDRAITSRTWSGRDLCPAAGHPYDNGCLLGKDDQIETPPVRLCGSDAQRPVCKGVKGAAPVSGYYRLSWNISWEGCAGEFLTKTPWDADPVIGRWAVTTQNPGQPKTTWLKANLQGSERAFQGPQRYELYFKLIGDQADARLSYRHLISAGDGGPYTGCPALVREIKLDSIDLDTYRSAAVVGTEKPNPSFEALALPGQELVRSKDVVADGPQGVRIDPAAGDKAWALAVSGPSGSRVNLPPGGYRAGFALRKPQAIAGADQIVTAAVTAGPDSYTTDGAPSTTDDGMPGPTNGRRPLVAGHLWAGDLAKTGETGSVDLLFEEKLASANLAFPVAVAKAAGPTVLDSVTIDRTPWVIGSINHGATYSGLGGSGQALNDGHGVVSSCGDGDNQSQPAGTGAWWVWMFLAAGVEGSSHDRFGKLCAGPLPSAGRWSEWRIVQYYDHESSDCDDHLDLSVEGGGNRAAYAVQLGTNYGIAGSTTNATPTLGMLTRTDDSRGTFKGHSCGAIRIQQAFMMQRPTALEPTTAG